MAEKCFVCRKDNLQYEVMYPLTSVKKEELIALQVRDKIS